MTLLSKDGVKDMQCGQACVLRRRTEQTDIRSGKNKESHTGKTNVLLVSAGETGFCNVYNACSVNAKFSLSKLFYLCFCDSHNNKIDPCGLQAVQPQSSCHQIPCL